MGPGDSFFGQSRKLLQFQQYYGCIILVKYYRLADILSLSYIWGYNKEVRPINNMADIGALVLLLRPNYWVTHK